MLIMNNITAGFSIPIVKKVNLEFKKGMVYGLIGPNGSGKSTLIKTIVGIVPIFDGEIMLNGINIKKYHEKQKARYISYMPQVFSVNFPFKVVDIVAMGRYPYEKGYFSFDKNSLNIAKQKLIDIGLIDLSEKSILEVSGGERQLISFAKVLAQDSLIMLLDEPNSNLDMHHQEKMFTLIKNEVDKGKIALIALHNIKTAAKFCDYLILMKDGKVYAKGLTSEVLTEENINNVYNINAVIYKNIFGLYDIELIEKQKGEKGWVHVVSGGGEGKEIYKALVEKGYHVTSGVLALNDTDFDVCRAFGIYTVTSKPFMPISEDEYIENVELIKRADFCLLCDIPFGMQNIKNLEALKYAKKLYIIEKASIEERDFTDGYAKKIYNNLKKRAKVINNISEII